MQMRNLFSSVLLFSTCVTIAPSVFGDNTQVDFVVEWSVLDSDLDGRTPIAVGQQVQLKDACQMPFVTDVHVVAGVAEPVIEIFEPGLAGDLKIVARRGQSVVVNADLRYTEIVDSRVEENVQRVIVDSQSVRIKQLIQVGDRVSIPILGTDKVRTLILKVTRTSQSDTPTRM